MADGITMEVLNFGSVLENFATYEVEVQARVQEILDIGGDVGLQLMDDLCPVDTGYLRSRNQKVVEPGAVTLLNDTPYAIFVELGHHTRSGTFVPPQAFIVPAFVVMEQFIQDELNRL